MVLCLNTDLIKTAQICLKFSSFQNFHKSKFNARKIKQKWAVLWRKLQSDTTHPLRTHLKGIVSCEVRCLNEQGFRETLKTGSKGAENEFGRYVTRGKRHSTHQDRVRHLLSFLRLSTSWFFVLTFKQTNIARAHALVCERTYRYDLRLNTRQHVTSPRSPSWSILFSTRLNYKTTTKLFK